MRNDGSASSLNTSTSFHGSDVPRRAYVESPSPCPPSLRVKLPTYISVGASAALTVRDTPVTEMAAVHALRFRNSRRLTARRSIAHLPCKRLRRPSVTASKNNSSMMRALEGLNHESDRLVDPDCPVAHRRSAIEWPRDSGPEPRRHL